MFELFELKTFWQQYSANLNTLDHCQASLRSSEHTKQILICEYCFYEYGGLSFTN